MPKRVVPTAAMGALCFEIGILTVLPSMTGCEVDHHTTPAAPKTSAAHAPRSRSTRLSRALLDESLGLGRRFLLSRQTQRGDFRYQVNFLTGEESQDPAQVRKAGALWGVAMIHQDRPSDQTRAALLRGFAFYRACSRPAEQGGRLIAYPGALRGETGTLALVSLALIDFLRAESDAECRRQLDDYLRFLLTLRTANGQFHQDYELDSGFSFSEPMPYFDGECLLALAKAARYLQREDLRAPAIESAHAMYEVYGKTARRTETDSPLTKGFYQWGSMAFFELHQSGWSNTECLAEWTIDLAHWMIDVHRTEERTLNTAYALEGLSCAYELARQTQQPDTQLKIGGVIERQLYKLTSWQLSSSIACDYLKQHASRDTDLAGGVMNARDDPELRIDVTQHQMHAVILARRYLWPR